MELTASTLGWSVEIVFDHTEQVKYPKVRYNFRSLMPKFWRTRRRTRIKVFIFKTFQGAQILIFFCENWQGASFYIKEQTKKYKFET